MVLLIKASTPKAVFVVIPPAPVLFTLVPLSSIRPSPIASVAVNLATLFIVPDKGVDTGISIVSQRFTGNISFPFFILNKLRF